MVLAFNPRHWKRVYVFAICSVLVVFACILFLLNSPVRPINRSTIAVEYGKRILQSSVPFGSNSRIVFRINCDQFNAACDWVFQKSDCGCTKVTDGIGSAVFPGTKIQKSGTISVEVNTVPSPREHVHKLYFVSDPESLRSEVPGKEMSTVVSLIYDVVRDFTPSSSFL